MNKLLPILLVLSFVSNSNAEYRSKAEEMLGKECINLDCALADEICGKKNENGIRKLNDDDCRMGVARHNMQTGKTLNTKPPSKDPCLEMDCSVTSKLASKICIDKSDFNNPKIMNETQCKMMIKRFQKRVMNGESHEDAGYFSVQESYDYRKGWKGFFNHSGKVQSNEREKERVSECAAALKRGVYKDKSDSWRRSKCRSVRY